ncbi:MAG: caspase family protein [Actinomycetota bacterium]|nr:caspase family protein [Actinomycetota bacterium]
MRRLAILVPLIALIATAGVGVAKAALPNGGDRCALVIGIDHHQGATRTNTGAIGDSEDMRAALVQAGWPSAKIRVITDGDATNAGIRSGLQWLASCSNDSSFSVLAYSGHVKQVGSTEYLWPSDNQHIPDTELAAALRGVKGYLWMHIAGCEAAGFDEGISGPKRLVTAASQAHEKGYELPDLRNSVFTNLLVDKGLLKKQADFNKDGKVSIQEAFRLAAERAPQLTAGEAYGPQHPYMAGGDGSEWFLQQLGKPTPTAFKKRCLLCF